VKPGDYQFDFHTIGGGPSAPLAVAWRQIGDEISSITTTINDGFTCEG
jgi:hypothetical protein